MGAPYTSVSISGYNANPPPDDGTQTEANRVKYSTIKTKLDDPLKTAIESINTNIGTAFAKIIGGGGVTSTGTTYTVLSTDQGKLVTATAATTITSPDATDVDEPFVFGLSNTSSGDVTFDGNGSQTIDGEASITLGPGEGVVVFTDGTNWFTIGRAKRSLVAPQGYLTLLAAGVDVLSPIIKTDIIAATSVYYRPVEGGNLLPIPDGTNFAVREFSELTLSLVSSHVANAIYDVFAFANPSGGAITIGTGPAWTTATAGSGARGSGAGTTELRLLKGLWVNNVAITARNGSTTYSVGAASAVYLGSIYIDGSAGQLSCHVTFGQSRKWGIWNAYNRQPIMLKAGDTGGSWNYTTDTFRAQNGSTTNSLTVFQGLAEERYFLQCLMSATNSTSTAFFRSGVGFNSTTTASGVIGGALAHTTQQIATSPATYVAVPSIGIHVITALERSQAVGTATWFGGEDDTGLIATWRG